MSAQISKKRKFVADGVFRAELNEFFTRELAEEGYSGCDVRVTHARTEVRNLSVDFYENLNWSRSSSAPHTHKRCLEKRVAVSVNSLLLFKNGSSSQRTLSNYTLKKYNTVVSRLLPNARVWDTSSLEVSLFAGLSVQSPSPIWFESKSWSSACYGVLRFVMESGAKGCEVVVSGKLRAARAKSMKFTDGFMIHSGQPARDFVDYAVRHVLLRQGVLGIKVKM